MALAWRRDSNPLPIFFWHSLHTIQYVYGGTIQYVYGGTIQYVEGGTIQYVEGGTIQYVYGGFDLSVLQGPNAILIDRSGPVPICYVGIQQALK